MNITHVVRGNEYLSSTPKYNLIYQAFNWQIPTYIHVPPVMKDAQNKLSKRNGDASYQDLINKGFLSEAIINYIALLGWSPVGKEEIFSLDDLVKQFTIERISKSPAIFDYEKLKWMNGVYLRNMPVEQFNQLAISYYQNSIKTKIANLDFSDEDKIKEKFIELAKKHEKKNGQIMYPIRVALTFKAFTPGGAVEIAHILGKDETIKRIKNAIEKLEEIV